MALSLDWSADFTARFDGDAGKADILRPACRLLAAMVNESKRIAFQARRCFFVSPIIKEATCVFDPEIYSFLFKGWVATSCVAIEVRYVLG